MGCQGRRGIRVALACALLLGALVGALPASAASSIAVNDVSVSESGDATFTVSRTADAFAPSRTVSFATAAGSASSPADYTAVSGSVTFSSTLLFGETQTRQVAVAIKPDALDEADETFKLVVSGPEVAGKEGIATIIDDDPPPAVSVSDAGTVAEGAPGAHAAFVVRLSAVSGRAVSVNYATADAGATAGSDYTARSGTLTIGAGATQATVDVPVLDDGADEPGESFELRLSSPVNATLASAVATATIADDDEPPQPVAPAGAGATTATPPSTPSIALPNLNSNAPATGPTTGSSATTAAFGVSAPRLRRPSTVLVTLSCPAMSGGCNGRVTIFSIPALRSKIKALRHERMLGRMTFSLTAGSARTLTLRLGRSDVALLRRSGRMRVRAYVLTQDGAGRTGVRSVNGTLIARTAHSSPSRK